MGLVAKQAAQGDFQIVPAGQYAGICYQVIELGHLFSDFYGKSRHRIRLVWELHGENQIGDGVATLPDGKPMVVGAEYTLTLADNGALKPLLESWRGRPFTAEELDGFDITKLLGAPCMVTVQHETENGKTYANVKSVSPLLKSLQKPVQVNPSFKFELDPWKQADFDALPEWLREKIKKSEEYVERFGGMAVQAPPARNDVPFDDACPF